MAATDPSHPVVICGAGIIGCSVAYYLAKRGVRCILLEQVAVASAASGRAGGFLARDWCEGGPVGPLARESFRLHAELAEEFGPSVIDYRRLDTLSVEFKGGEGGGGKAGNLPDWVTGPVGQSGRLGDGETTAQVHPHKLTSALAAGAAKLAGSEVRIATVTGLQTVAQPDGQLMVTQVLLADAPPVPCSAAVLSMGPWTDRSLPWVGQPAGQIRGHRAHSLVMKPAGDAPVSAHALFAEMEGGRESPEFYPRPDGSVYVCGVGDDPQLPESAGQVTPDSDRSERLLRLAGACSDRLATGRVLARQACFLPLAERGRPLIGRAPGHRNAYVATGHSCWGILNGPATGRMLADLIVDGRCEFIDPGLFAL